MYYTKSNNAPLLQLWGIQEAIISFGAVKSLPQGALIIAHTKELLAICVKKLN
jgi:hypothetical protein